MPNPLKPRSQRLGQLIAGSANAQDVNSRLPQFSISPWLPLSGNGTLAANVALLTGLQALQYRMEQFGPDLQMAGGITATGSITAGSQLFTLSQVGAVSPPRTGSVYMYATLKTGVSTYSVVPLALSEVSSGGTSVVQCITLAALSSGNILYFSADVPLTAGVAGSTSGAGTSGGSLAYLSFGYGS